MLKSLGLGKLAHAWLNDPGTALICNQVPFIFYVGLTMIIFLTQLSTVPKELKEAAMVEMCIRDRGYAVLAVEIGMIYFCYIKNRPSVSKSMVKVICTIPPVTRCV